VGHGGKRPNSGRKPKADEAKLIERLTPLADSAFSALEAGLVDGQNWAVKLWFEYYYGKPTQTIDVTTDGERVALPPFMKSNESKS
jgi:hypothetical protein